MTDKYKDVDSAYNMSRRAWLERALALGLFSAAGAVVPTAAYADFWGRRPRRMKAGASFFNINGTVTVNGVVADLTTQVRPGDRVETSADGKTSFVVGRDAYLLRGNSELDLAPAEEEDDLIASGIQLLKGAALMVFGKSPRPRNVSTSLATIGLRGTGLYLESEADKTYFCLCYGEVDLTPTADSSQSENIKTRHHDAPKYIRAEDQGAGLITPAPVINHTDLELAVLEELVGREVPFALPDDYYSAPRRDSDY